jgi:nucleoside-diphosphate-sugar epimerase
VHTAARVHVLDERSVDPLAAFRKVNVDGTLDLARQAADAGVRRFVFVSSIKVNGESTRPGVPFTTQDPPRPEDPYGISKSEAELALRTLASQRGIEVVIVRPPLVYGPGVRANFRALMRLLTLPVPLPFGSIDNRRSMVSVGNLVDFLVRCIDAHAAANATFLVSDDEDVSTTGLMRRLAGAMKKRPWLLPVSPPILIALGAVGGQSERMRRLCESLQVDISGTRQALAWSPPSTLEQGLFETAQWYLRETVR